MSSQRQTNTLDNETNVRLVARAWDLLYRNPALLGWRILADLVGFALQPLGALVVVLAVSSGLVRGGWVPEQPNTIFAAWRTVDIATYGAGLLGMIVTLGLVGLVVRAIANGGIWSSLRAGLRGENGAESSFATHVTNGFPRAAKLELVKLAVRWTLFALLATIGTALGVAFFGGGLREAPVAVQVTVISVPLFVYLVLAALLRLTIEVASAPLFLEERPIGESVARAAAFTLRRLASVYRILARVLGYLVVPLFGYWGFAMLANFAEAGPSIMAVLNAGRFVGQIILMAAFATFTLLLHSAFFTYWAVARDLESAPAIATEDSRPHDETGPGYDQSTTLENLLPDSFPHVRRVESTEPDSSDEA